MFAKIHRLVGWLIFFAASSAATIAVARTNTVRIVTYNIAADTVGFSDPWSTPRPGLIQPATSGGAATGTTADGGALEAIGELPVGASNNFQPIDILLLQETTSNAVTVAPIVTALNSYYGAAATYAQSPFQATQSSAGNGHGNGPNALVYNQQKLQLLASDPVPLPAGQSLGSSSGIYRQVMRYKFEPIGGTSADDFYIYDSHYKSGGASDDFSDRNKEAVIIRNDAAGLPSNSRIIYAGDYNVSTSSDASYQTIVGTGTSSVNVGVDPFNPSATTGINWSSSGSPNVQKTDSASFLGDRYDFLNMTSPLNPANAFNAAGYNSTQRGLQLIPNTYRTVGNNGTTPYGSAVNISGNTSMANVQQFGTSSFIDGSTAKTDLRWASDHLPVMGDFSIGPGVSIWNGSSNTNWNKAQNWDSAPIDGDSLQFAGVNNTGTTNDSLNVVGAITFNSGAGMFALSNGTVTSITNLGGITNNSSNTQTVNLSQTLGAAQTFNANTANLTIGGTIANGGNLLTITGSSNTTLGTTVSGAGGLAKTGAGTLILNGNNAYTGGTTVSGGTVQLGNARGIGSTTATLTVNTGGTFDLHGFSTTIGPLNGTGGSVQTNVAGAATFTVGGAASNGSYAGQIQNGSGTVALIKGGIGTQTLSGNNTYSGGTTVTGGTLQLGHVNALGSTSGGLTLNTSGSTLDLHGFSPTVGALNGSGGMVQSNVAGGATFTIGNGGAGGSYGGTVVNGTGTVSLIKTGAGTQTLSGNNTYSGGTTVTGGTLQLGHVNALGSTSGRLTVNSGIIDLHGFSPTVGALNGSGGAVQSNVAGAATVTIGNGGAGGSYGGTVVNGTGTVSLIKTGAGTQTLSGNNSYSGGTTVAGGTLVVGHLNALGTGGLNIRTAATAQIVDPLVGALVLPSLTIQGGTTPTGTLDITDNNVIVRNGDLATLTAQVASGFNGFSWTGTGITSSTAVNNPTLNAVGIIPNTLDGGDSALYDHWPVGADDVGGPSVDQTDVLIKYTYTGDANLDGVVDADTDYALWNIGLSSDGSLSGWLWGDFDYSGTIDVDTDYTLWNLAFSAQTPGNGLGGGVQPVPEPSTLVLAALGLAGVAAFARRRR